MISRVLTNYIVGLVKEIGGQNTKTPAAIVGAPLAFPFRAFPLTPFPSPFSPSKQATPWCIIKPSPINIKRKDKAGWNVFEQLIRK